jgi:PBP1b-binding outer membrane lipoprotein LpoB
MKKLFALLVIAFAIDSCSEKKAPNESVDSTDAKDSTSTAAEQRDWKEMDDFHMIMAETFHPYKDDNNLKPAKEKAKQLDDEAARWSASALPAKVNNEEMQQKLNSLKAETAKLASMVGDESDEAIGAQLTKVHDIFHEIQEAWYGGHGHEH